MSARGRWIAGAAAFTVGGLLASIPAFLGHSSSSPARVRQQPRWLETLSPRSTILASSSGGEQFLVHRMSGRPEYVCFRLGSVGGGSCGPLSATTWMEPLLSKDIALIGRSRDQRGIGWWGVVGDDVDAVRVRYATRPARRIPVHRGFVTFGAPLSVAALVHGNEVGRVDATDIPTINCTPMSCSTLIVAHRTADALQA